MKQLKDSNLFGLQIPQDAENYIQSVIGEDLIFATNTGQESAKLHSIHIGFDFKIIGTITAEKVFDFDAERFVQKTNSFFEKKMESDGFYFVNPFGNSEPIIFRDDRLNQWQQAESNTLKNGYKWLWVEKIN